MTIPYQEHLLRYWLDEGMTFREAFVKWGDALMTLADLREMAHVDQAAIDNESAHAYAVHVESIGIRIAEREVARRAAFAPLFSRQGLTLRQIASSVDLTLEQVVMVYGGGKAAARATAYADVEELLLSGALLTQSAHSLAVENDLTEASIKRFCQRHGIDAMAAAEKRKVAA